MIIYLGYFAHNGKLPFPVVWSLSSAIPAGAYLLKVSNGNTRIMCEIYSNLTIKTSK